MSDGSSKSLRCAVYTRKSSEEGLDMAFNSLDAQREAGLDYIKSQRGQGWVALPAAYDDGGFSGGNTDRPGLQRLLADIKAQRIDIVIVYKVDRLSRSLTDFARLMQSFDEHKVSFVSVTQQFNTTTSMGRLTLNMLLSFAQFEREVTGERIRDKIAASKRKGIYVVGTPPLGYRRPGPRDPDPNNRVIRVIPQEAVLVRRIFDLYLQHHSPLAVAAALNAEGARARQWSGARDRGPDQKPWCAALIGRALANPIYIGKITHIKGHNQPRGTERRLQEIWPGLHEPIIDQQTWNRVRSMMDAQKPKAEARWSHTHLLKGKIRTFEGFAMTPSNSSKTNSGGQRIITRYYVSLKASKHGYSSCPIRNVNATLVDDLVRAMVLDRLESAHGLVLDAFGPEIRDHWVRRVLVGVVLALDHVEATISASAARECAEALGEPARTPGGPRPARRCHFTPEVRIEGEDRKDRHEILTVHLQLKRHDGRRLLLSPEGRDLLPRLGPRGKPDPAPRIVRAIGQAFALHDEILRTRDDVNDVAERCGIHRSRVHLLLHLTRLSPTVIKAALTGTLSPQISLEDLHAAAQHLDWSLQATHLGLPHSGG